MECAYDKAESLPLDGTLKRSSVRQVRTYDELPEDVRTALMQRSGRPAEETTLDKMDRRFMMTVLVYLHHNRPALKSDIRADVSRNASMSDRLRTLVDLGLVRVHSTVRHNSGYIVLTPKGRKVAGMVEEMMRVIDTWPDGGDGVGEGI